MKSLANRSILLMTHGSNRRGRNLKRRMSVKGAVKKTRSINVDCKFTIILAENVNHKIIVVILCKKDIFN